MPWLRFGFEEAALAEGVFWNDGLEEELGSGAVRLSDGNRGRFVSADVDSSIKGCEACVRFGGVLESFHGDKLWVSFNATSKCDHHEVAAAYFAYHVTTVVNESAIAGLGGRFEGGMRPLPAPDPSISSTDPRFAACRWGITCGAATGEALVGSVEGEDTGRRTTLISNAVPRAAELERLCKSYPDAGAIVAGDMISAIEGYCQYQVVDAMLLPGSGGKRVRIACLKGADGWQREGCWRRLSMARSVRLV